MSFGLHVLYDFWHIDTPQKCIFADLLHGRRIARAIWDYYKTSGIITESCYVDPRTIAPEEEPGGEAAFSVLKLRELSRNADLFESDYSSSGDDEDSDYDVDQSCWYVNIQGPPIQSGLFKNAIQGVPFFL